MQTVFARGYEPNNDDRLLLAQPSEYVFSHNTDDELMPVYLLGAVAKPGLYNIPLKLDLPSLFSVAGGFLESAETSKIVIRRKAGTNVENFNFDNFVSDNKKLSPELKSNDIVWVPVKEPVISKDTVLIVSVVAGVLGIVLSGFLISKTLKD